VNTTVSEDEDDDDCTVFLPSDGIMSREMVVMMSMDVRIGAECGMCKGWIACRYGC
jgi:hypothetical protein